MKEKSLLIIGSGGYIDAVVLPEIKSHFPNLKIGVLSRRPHRSKTFALQNDLYEVKNLEEIKDYNYYFLASSPLDFTTYINYFSEGSHLWLEKPISELALEEHNLIKESLKKFSTIRVGFNKRFLLPQELLESPNLQGEITFHVERNEASSKSLWKDYMIQGGVYWSDGVHAIDLAQFVLGIDSQITFKEFNQSLLHAEVTHGESKIDVKIGNDQKNRIKINQVELKDFMTNEISRSLFNQNFSEFMKEKSNIEDTLIFNQNCIEAYKNFIQ